MIRPPSTIISLLLIAGSFAGGYFYYSEFLGEPELPPPIPVFGKITLDSLASISFDFSILDDEVFKSLRQYGESPVNPGVTGRRDIFAPVQ